MPLEAIILEITTLPLALMPWDQVPGEMTIPLGDMRLCITTLPAITIQPGDEALLNSTSDHNTGLGYHSAWVTTTGFQNTAIGSNYYG